MEMEAPSRVQGAFVWAWGVLVDRVRSTGLGVYWWTPASFG